MAKELRMSSLPASHGRYIYAYCNIRTNQVLYSLERTLKNSHLKQLADVGANNNPPKLRKDIWRPLYTVALPDSGDGRHQGLELFRSLREYRMLHETTWELPEEIKRPYTEKEIEAMQRKLDDRGGSKKETVYDIIKREKWKMRVRMVMNQKANSIADLAAILLRQAEHGAKTAQERAAAEPSRRQNDIMLMVNLAKQHENGELVQLAEKVKQLEDEVRENQAKSRNKEYKSKERKAFYQQSLRQQRETEDTQLLMQKMEWSAKVVSNAQYWFKAQSDMQQLAANMKAIESDLLEAERKSDDTELPSEEREAAYQDALRMKRIINNSNWFMEKTKWVGLVPSDAESRARLVAPMTQEILNGWMELAADAGETIRQARRDLAEPRRQMRTLRKNDEQKAAIQSQMEAIKQRIAQARFARTAAAEHDNNFVNVAIEARLAGYHAGDSEVSKSSEQDQEIVAADFAELLSRYPANIAADDVAPTAEAQLAEDNVAADSTEGSPAEQSAAEGAIVEEGAGKPVRLRDYRPFLPEFPPELDFVQAARQGFLLPLNRSKREKKALKPKLKLTAPIFTDDGVTVKWSNILDAEFAEVWPEGVKHEPLGFAKYTAPKPDAKPREGPSYLEPHNAEVDETRGGHSAVEAEAEAAAEDRQTIVDKIKDKLLARANKKALAPAKKRHTMDKDFAREEADKLKNAQAKQIQSSEPPAQEDAPSL